MLTCIFLVGMIELYGIQLFFKKEVCTLMRALKRMIICLCCFAALVVGCILPQNAKAASNMQVSSAMVNVLKTMEGFNAKPYWDYAQWTVGYGTKCPEDKRTYYETYGITEAEALVLLQQELDSFEASVNSFADTYGLKLKQNQFDALVSFSYNCGTGWMSETTGYFNTAVRSGDMGSALIYGMCLFSSAGEDYILSDRRLCEAYMYIDGGYKASNDTTTALPERYRYVYLEGNGGKVRYTTCGYDANAGTPINVSFSSIPTGVDSNGKPFVYELAGWYTEDGKKVEKLDTSLKIGQVLYARWKDPSGKVVSLPMGEPVNNLAVTLTADGVNVRSGPGTYFPRINYLNKGTALTVTEVRKTSYYTWGKTQYGWVCLDYTNYNEVAGSTGTFPKSGTVTGTYVNYRTAPSTSNSQVVGQKGLGDRVTITQETYADGLPWGKMMDGYWICLDYVRYDEDVPPAVTGVTLLRAPTKTWYNSVQETLELEGSILQVSYSDGSISALTLTREIVTSFKETSKGVGTVAASYSGKTVSFTVKLGTFTVTFKNWDGSVLSSAEYVYGDTVNAPAAPVKPTDNTYTYTFAGWDKTVAVCTSDAVYTAVFTPNFIAYTVTFQQEDGTVIRADSYHYGDAITPPDAPEKPADNTYTYAFAGWDKPVTACVGDAVYTAQYTPVYIDYTVTFLNKDGALISSNTYHYGDVITVPEAPDRPAGIPEEEVFRGWNPAVSAICRKSVVYTAVFTDSIPRGDLNGDGYVSDADALYLLRHTLFAQRYPLNQDGDCNGDGAVSDTDALYLLRHALFADRYPLS